MKRKKRIAGFYLDELSVLDTFAALTIRVPWGLNDGNLEFPTAEHAYQAAKFVYAVPSNGGTESPCRDAFRAYHLICGARSPHEAKEIGQRFKRFRDPDWDRKKLATMKEVSLAKFRDHMIVRRVLEQTNDRPIVEKSPDNPFWGWGKDKKGLNKQGLTWMEIRLEKFGLPIVEYMHET